jgi:putative flavoprotein involved in K+ transport
MLDKAPNQKLAGLLEKFGAALASGDIDAAVSLFQDDCYWRDLVAFTWNLRTMEGKEQIRDMLKSRLADVGPSNWAVAEGEDAAEANGLLEGWISFETKVARGYGQIRLKDGKIWTLLTTMAELKGHEEKAGFTRPLGAKHGHGKGRKSWKEEREEEIAELGFSRQPYCVIVGGGQGGIALGARLKQLGVSTIIVEKNERPGDSWRKRYKSLCLHDPVWYYHLPYIDFPKNWRCSRQKTRSATGWRCTPG